MTLYRQKFGKFGENAALEEALRRGYQPLNRNFRAPFGEIDLVLFDPLKNDIVFAEVKTRSSLKYGYPEEGVTAKKLNHMINCAKYYIEQKHGHEEKPWRIDVIAIVIERQSMKVINLKWIENVTATL